MYTVLNRTVLVLNRTLLLIRALWRLTEVVTNTMHTLLDLDNYPCAGDYAPEVVEKQDKTKQKKSTTEFQA